MSCIRIAAKVQPAKQAIIVFHGLGDTGMGWTFLAEHLQKNERFQRTNFIFPTAPTVPVAMAGCRMPSWFDLFEPGFDTDKWDVDGIKKSLNILNGYVKEQMDAGIYFGVVSGGVIPDALSRPQ